MEASEDIQTIRRVLAGDRNAFSLLVDSYRDMVYTLCVRMLGNETDAAEAAQDVFVKAFRALEGFREKSKFSTWLYRIAYNHCISVIRKKVKIIDLVDEFPDTDEEREEWNGLDTLSDQERSRYLKLAMESLPETDAVVVTLFYYEELSLEEIAEITGLSNSNIRIKLHRSRKRMYQMLMKMLKSEVTSIL